MHIRKEDRDAMEGVAMLLAHGLKIAWNDIRGREFTAEDEAKLREVKKRAKEKGVS
jgi:hypothetical protein